jgi:hypothetical protein
MKLRLRVSHSKILLNKSMTLIAGVVQSVCCNEFVGPEDHTNFKCVQKPQTVTNEVAQN